MLIQSEELVRLLRPRPVVKKEAKMEYRNIGANTRHFPFPCLTVVWYISDFSVCIKRKRKERERERARVQKPF